MGRFKWLEVDKNKSGGEESAEKKLEAAGEKASKKIAEIQNGAETVQKNHGGVTKFGKTSESDGVIYDSDYFKNEGLKNYETCEYEQALYNFSKSLSENNKDEEAWLYQILTQIHLGKYSDALIWAKKAYEYFSSSPEAQAMLALALALNGEKESAMAYSDGAVAKNRPGFFMWFARGEVLLQSENLNNAFICFKKCADFKRVAGAKSLDFEIAMALLRAKRHTQALSYFKKAVQGGMCNFFIYEKIAYLNEMLEFLDEAQFYYRQSLNLKASNAAAQEGESRVRSQNTFFIKIFNKIYKFFKLGGQKNE
ncbi:MAG TPA: CDC27 family protein [Candidatus Wallbacteria bacterium]|nr:CDC27 family protein [Candidatus Wallbacteria bacterium]